MPLLQYFGFVGGALLMMLFGANWLMPQPAEVPVPSNTVRPTIRISSVERLPERVVIDTSLPTIVPPQSAIEPFEHPPQGRLVEITPEVRQAASSPDRATLKRHSLTKREVARKNTAPRTPNHQMAQSRSVQPAAPVVRMSLLEMVKERLQHGLFNFN